MYIITCDFLCFLFQCLIESLRCQRTCKNRCVLNNGGSKVKHHYIRIRAHKFHVFFFFYNFKSV